jgi:hypothetical protein
MQNKNLLHNKIVGGGEGGHILCIIGCPVDLNDILMYVNHFPGGREGGGSGGGGGGGGQKVMDMRLTV